MATANSLSSDFRVFHNANPRKNIAKEKKMAYVDLKPGEYEEWASPKLDLLLFVLIMPLFGIIVWQLIWQVEEWEIQYKEQMKKKEVGTQTD